MPFKMRFGVIDANLHPRLFTREGKGLDIVPLRLHLRNMKTTQLSMLAWIACAVIVVASLASCSTQGHQTCSAYQEVPVATQPGH